MTVNLSLNFSSYISLKLNSGFVFHFSSSSTSEKIIFHPSKFQEPSIKPIFAIFTKSLSLFPTQTKKHSFSIHRNKQQGKNQQVNNPTWIFVTPLQNHRQCRRWLWQRGILGEKSRLINKRRLKRPTKSRLNSLRTTNLNRTTSQKVFILIFQPKLMRLVTLSTHLAPAHFTIFFIHSTVAPKIYFSPNPNSHEDHLFFCPSQRNSQTNLQTSTRAFSPENRKHVNNCRWWSENENFSKAFCGHPTKKKVGY